MRLFIPQGVLHPEMHCRAPFQVTLGRSVMLLLQVKVTSGLTFLGWLFSYLVLLTYAAFNVMLCYSCLVHVQVHMFAWRCAIRLSLLVLLVCDAFCHANCLLLCCEPALELIVSWQVRRRHGDAHSLRSLARRSILASSRCLRPTNMI